MILVDFQLDELCRQHQLVSPFDPARINSASVDLTLGREFLNLGSGVVAYWEDDKPYFAIPNERFLADKVKLKPGDFVLGATAEKVKLLDRETELHSPVYYDESNRRIYPIVPLDSCAASLCLKSSAAREGLNHSLAGWCDPGFEGNLTLEFHCQRPVTLVAGESYCQIIVHSLSAKPLKSYKQTGRYVGEYAQGAVEVRKGKDGNL